MAAPAPPKDRERLEPVELALCDRGKFCQPPKHDYECPAHWAETHRRVELDRQRVARLVLLWAADSLSSGYLLPDGMKKIANDPSRVAYLLRLLEGKG